MRWLFFLEVGRLLCTSCTITNTGVCWVDGAKMIIWSFSLSIVTVSLDCQKDIDGDSLMKPTYLFVSNITLITKERVLNNISCYLLLNLSRHWHRLTVNLPIFLLSTWLQAKLSNCFSNNNIPLLLHSVSAKQQQNFKASLLGHCRKINNSLTLYQLFYHF